ncbi:hypothetical protein ANN_16374 [Periplaneta americana]|uniref:Uncharacterized protein n=1 Tax=Periplaneta americana TaxID=6978 RepID=A0ABQ8SKQ6_PERAM|nr:hypothetical protein ANN_16374 [Periplaneta americana]
MQLLLDFVELPLESLQGCCFVLAVENNCRSKLQLRSFCRKKCRSTNKEVKTVDECEELEGEVKKCASEFRSTGVSKEIPKNGEENNSCSSALCNFLHSPVTSSLLAPNIFLSALFSNTLNLYINPNIFNTKCNSNSNVTIVQSLLFPAANHVVGRLHLSVSYDMIMFNGAANRFLVCRNTFLRAEFKQTLLQIQSLQLQLAFYLQSALIEELSRFCAIAVCSKTAVFRFQIELSVYRYTVDLV